MITVLFWSRFLMALSRSRSLCLSRLAVISSRIITCGLRRNRRIMLTNRASPDEILPSPEESGNYPVPCGNPVNQLVNSSALMAARIFSSRMRESNRVMLSRRDACMSWTFWGQYTISRLSFCGSNFSTGIPFTRTAPCWQWYRPARSFTRVVLPQPVSP